MKDLLFKLHNLTTTTINMIEDELKHLEDQNGKKIKEKKSIADTLPKLANLLVTLNKMKRSGDFEEEAILRQDDVKIIQDFLQKHETRSKNT